MCQTNNIMEAEQNLEIIEQKYAKKSYIFKVVITIFVIVKIVIIGLQIVHSKKYSSCWL